MLILGQQGVVLRVQTPTGQIGYVTAKAVEAAVAAPLRRLSLPVATDLLAGPERASPAWGALAARTPVVVLGQAAQDSLLRGPQGETGWAIL